MVITTNNICNEHICILGAHVVDQRDVCFFECFQLSLQSFYLHSTRGLLFLCSACWRSRVFAFSCADVCVAELLVLQDVPEPTASKNQCMGLMGLLQTGQSGPLSVPGADHCHLFPLAKSGCMEAVSALQEC